MGAASLKPASGQKRRGQKDNFVVICYVGGLGSITAGHVSGLWAEAHAPEGGITSPYHTALDIADVYLPNLADSHSVAVFSNLPLKQFAQWTYLQRYPRRTRLETDVKSFDPRAADNTLCFTSWLGRTDCDTVVYIDFAPGTPFYRYVPGCENLEQYGEMLQKQTRFTITDRYVLTSSGCTVTVWKQPLVR